MADQPAGRISQVLGFLMVAVPVAAVVLVVLAFGVLPRVAAGEGWPTALILTAVGFLAAFGFWYSVARIQNRCR